MCRKWAMNQLERKFNLAVLISLREAQKALSIEDIFPQSIKILKGILAALGDGNGLLLVLDGFDELVFLVNSNNLGPFLSTL